MSEFSELKGKTLVSVEGLHPESDRVVFVCSDGSKYVMDHGQDCCESVALCDVVGAADHLIGSPIVDAYESTSDQWPIDWPQPYVPESFTWTFYRLRTAKGTVVLRWLGESNGYYSESVDFEKESP